MSLPKCDFWQINKYKSSAPFSEVFMESSYTSNSVRCWEAQHSLLLFFFSKQVNWRSAIPMLAWLQSFRKTVVKIEFKLKTQKKQQTNKTYTHTFLQNCEYWECDVIYLHLKTFQTHSKFCPRVVPGVRIEPLHPLFVAPDVMRRDQKGSIIHMHTNIPSFYN